MINLLNSTIDTDTVKTKD